MISLFLLIVFGLGMAFFATQNTGIVHIVFGTYIVAGISLYVVVIASLLLGVFVSWLISIVDRFSSTMTIHGKESEIKKAQKMIGVLQDEVHDLEIENVRLKEEIEKKEGAKESMQAPEEHEKKSFLHSLQQSLRPLHGVQ